MYVSYENKDIELFKSYENKDIELFKSIEWNKFIIYIIKVCIYRVFIVYRILKGMNIRIIMFSFRFNIVLIIK